MMLLAGTAELQYVVPEEQPYLLCLLAQVLRKRLVRSFIVSWAAKGASVWSLKLQHRLGEQCQSIAHHPGRRGSAAAAGRPWLHSTHTTMRHCHILGQELTYKKQQTTAWPAAS